MANELMICFHRNMEADLEAERKREELREKARVEEREKTRRKQLAEKEKRERAEIEMKNLSEDEKTKLLREHDENLKRFDEALKKEQEKVMCWFIFFVFDWFLVNYIRTDTVKSLI